MDGVLQGLAGLLRGISQGAALSARGKPLSFQNLLLGFTFYINRFFSTFQNIEHMQSKYIFARLIKSTSDAKYQILGQLSVCQIYVRNCSEVCCFVKGPL